MYVNAYMRSWLDTGVQNNVILVRITQTFSVSTVIENTKVCSDLELERPLTFELYRLLLKQYNRNEEEKDPCIRGISNRENLHESRSIQLKILTDDIVQNVTQNDDSCQELADHIWRKLRFQEYLSSMSKILDGGSYYVGIAQETKQKPLTIQGFKLSKNKQQSLISELNQKLNEIVVLKPDGHFQSGREVRKLIDIKCHPIGSGQKVVLEIAVRFVAGVVFYERGPKAYKIEQLHDGSSKIVQMSEEEWYQRLILLGRMVRCESCRCQGNSTHEDTPCRSYPESQMSTSSDSDVTDSVSSQVKIALPSNANDQEDPRNYITMYSKNNLDPGLKHLFENILKEVQGKCKFYPMAMHKELENCHPAIISSIEELGYEDCFVLVGRSLVSTLNLRNNLIVVPKPIICDVCIVSDDNPVIVLSFNKDTTDNDKCEIYNTYLAREVNDLLRTFMDDLVSVVNGSVVKGSELKQQVKHLIKASDSFFSITPRTITVSQANGTHESAVTTLLLGISRAQTYSFLLNKSSEGGKVWTLTVQELKELMNIIDDITAVDYDINCENTLLMLEIACRKSRRRHILLDLTEQQINLVDIERLRQWYPKLELGNNARHTGDGHICGKLKRIRPVLKQGNISSPGKETKKQRKGMKSHFKQKKERKERKMNPSTSDRGKETDKDAELNTGHSRLGEYRKVATDLFQLVGYLLMSLLFLTLYGEEIPESWSFCAAKCAPLLYLVICALSHFYQSNEYRCGVLLLGLIFSCIGDALLVWKKHYLNIGIVTFGLAHLAYAFAFGWQPLNWKSGVPVAFVAFVSFSYFTSQLKGEICHVLLFYTFTITLMGWRVLTRADMPSNLSIVSTVCFLICNIAIGVDIFVYPFRFSHLISMVLYYVAQLGITLSILKSTDGFAKNNSETERYYTKLFVCVAVTVLLFHAFFGIHFLSKIYAMKTVLLDLAPFFIITTFTTFRCYFTLVDMSIMHVQFISTFTPRSVHTISRT